MKFHLALSLPVLAAAAKYSKDDYTSGKVHMESVARKQASWARQRESGEMDSSQWPSWDKWGRKGNWRQRRDYVPCVDGFAVVEEGNANQTFQCSNIDLYDFKSHADMQSWAGEGSDTWGWVGPGGREFIAIGQADGTAFCEITKRGKLVYLGRLPQQSVSSIWHDIKGYKNYIVVGSEAEGHGVQIFDMTKLLDKSLPSNPKNFSTTSDLTGWYNQLPSGRSHNLVMHEEKDYMVAVGAQPRNDSCASGLIYIDLSDPSNPVSPGCAGQDGYSHDAQCVVYHGPDSRYEGRDICYSFNEDTVTIYDSTNREGLNTSTIISRTPYTGAAYTHQGWLLDESWQQYLLSDDELDEVDGVEPAADGRSVMYIWDISDLENPINTGYHKATTRSIDHNLYVHDGLAYQSNYGSGLRVLDVSGIPEDPTGGNVYEYAFFDIYPEDDAEGGIVEFVGTWSNYLFPSGYVFVNTIERGGFVLKLSEKAGGGSGGKGKGKGRWWKN